MVVVIIASTVLALSLTSGTSGCSGEVVLSVEVAPRVTAPVRSAAEKYQETAPEAGGQCVTVRVTTQAPHETTRLFGDGWPEDAAGGRGQPDVWIPDSTAWLELARLAEPARRLLPEKGTTVATSPVVIAMPREMAEELDWPRKHLTWKDLQTNEGNGQFWATRGHADWGPFRVVLAHPQASSASADAMLSMVSAAMGTPVTQLDRKMFTEDVFVKKVVLELERNSGEIPASDDVLLTELRQADTDGRLVHYLSAAPMAESAVFAYNRGVVVDGKATLPREPLVAAYPPDGAVLQEIPYVTSTAASSDPARSAAAEAFLQVLLGETGQAAFTADGLRTPGGTNPMLTVDAGFSPDLRSGSSSSSVPEARAAALVTFQTLHQRATSLAVFDTSGSMESEVPGSGGKTRLHVVAEAAEAAVALVADDSNLGVWQFSTKLDGEKDYRELVPVGPMNEPFLGVTRSVAVVGAIRSMRPGGATGLYDTALAAFRTLSVAYTPDRPNQVVLMTDGRNEDPGSISLDELVATLKREYDPARPVHLITIGYGEEPDQEALQRISAATEANSYRALDPNSIFRLIVDIVSAQ